MKTHNAGYEIVKSYNYAFATGGTEYYVVLAKNTKENAVSKWVTWESIDLETFFWGHYFEDESHAEIDYFNRIIKRLNEKPY